MAADSSPMLLYSNLLLAAFLHLWTLLAFYILWKYWWNPRAVSRFMAQQGVSGPPPHLIRGNLPEMTLLSKQVFAKDMSTLSHDIAHRILPQYYHWSKIYGVNFLCWWGTRPAMFIASPNLVKQVLNSRLGHGMYDKSSDFVKRRQPLFGDGLLSVSGPAWEKQRAIVGPSFHTEKTKLLVSDMVKCGEQMILHWTAMARKSVYPIEIDVNEEFGKLTANVISCTAFGSSYEEGKQVFEQMSLLQELLAEADRSSFPGKSLLPTTLNRRIWQVGKNIDSSLHEIVQERRNALLSGKIPTYGDDLLGLMLSECQRSTDTNGKFAIESVVSECKTIYFAAYETTSLLLAWTLMLLCVHPEWQERARCEVQEVCKGASFEANMLVKMKILGMILNESIRLYPPAAMTLREALADTKLGDLCIPKGMLMWVAIIAIHHDTKVWGADASEFKPERFVDGVAKACKQPSGFIPFGFGPRSCLGATFATMESKIILALILSKFRCTLSPTYRHAPVSILTTQPLHGIPINIHPLEPFT